MTHWVTREFGCFNHNPIALNDMYQHVPYCKVVLPKPSPEISLFLLTMQKTKSAHALDIAEQPCMQSCYADFTIKISIPQQLFSVTRNSSLSANFKCNSFLNGAGNDRLLKR